MKFQIRRSFAWLFISNSLRAMESNSLKITLSVALLAIISNSLVTRGSYLLVELSSSETLPETLPPKPEYPIPQPLEPRFPESPKPGHPRARSQIGVDYNPDPEQMRSRNLGGRQGQCLPENECARAEDPTRSIAAKDEDITGRGSRYWPYSCCYRYWWNGYYYCRWSYSYCYWF